ncbi:MAG TPA: hypothetical protein VGQ59_05255 [Cyclobacteriaceae bacterium]|jgi:hypothetical protein|nr:hypothetical protein [Cyclobacteriaceae bacterium]
MNRSVISGVVGGLLAVVICTYISKSVRNSSVHGQLKFGSFLIVLAWLCFAFVLFSVVGLLYIVDMRKSPGDLIPFVGIFIGFGAGAIYCFGEYFKTHGSFDDEGIVFSTPWTGQKSEKWESLVSVKFNQTANWYVLTFQSGNKIRLSNLLSGHGSVLDFLKLRGLTSVK